MLHWVLKQSILTLEKKNKNKTSLFETIWQPLNLGHFLMAFSTTLNFCFMLYLQKRNFTDLLYSRVGNLNESVTKHKTDACFNNTHLGGWLSGSIG